MMKYLKYTGVTIIVLLFFWSMVVNATYESEKEHRLLCEASGGDWIRNDVLPLEPVDGKCL